MNRHFWKSPLALALMAVPSAAQSLTAEDLCLATQADDALVKLNHEINVATWDTLETTTLSPQQFNQTSRDALRLAIIGSHEASGVELDDIEASFEQTRAFISYRLLRDAEKLIGGAAGSDLSQQIETDIAASRYVDPFEWVEYGAASIKKKDSDLSWEVARSRSFREFHGRCGGNGLTPFFIPGREFPDAYGMALADCPGTRIAMHGALGEGERELILDAFAFSHGHNFGAVIATTAKAYWEERSEAEAEAHRTRYPELYDPLHWAMLALVERMNSHNLDNRRKVLLAAMVSFCTPDVPKAASLLPWIARHPALAAALGS